MKALVTGGSRGIGAAIVTRLRADGVEVVAPTREELPFGGFGVAATMIRLQSSYAGGFDILVNCAGINEVRASLTATWESIGVNAIAPLQLIDFAAEKMARNNFGRIVNVSSILASRAKPGRCAYSMSKAALEALTRSVAVEYGPKGILCNAVAPGYVETDMTTRNNTPEQLDEIRRRIPLQRLAKPEEVAELVAFLASPRNTYINGQVITIDGGLTCGV